MLMIPTSVADVSCHAVSPEFSQLGSGFRADKHCDTSPLRCWLGMCDDVRVAGNSVRGGRAVLRPSTHRSTAAGLYSAHESQWSKCTGRPHRGGGSDRGSEVVREGTGGSGVAIRSDGIAADIAKSWAGTGLPVKYPCARSQPSSASNSSVASVSIPSATTSRPSA